MQARLPLLAVGIHTQFAPITTTTVSWFGERLRALWRKWGLVPEKASPTLSADLDSKLFNSSFSERQNARRPAQRVRVGSIASISRLCPASAGKVWLADGDCGAHPATERRNKD